MFATIKRTTPLDSPVPLLRGAVKARGLRYPAAQYVPWQIFDTLDRRRAREEITRCGEVPSPFLPEANFNALLSLETAGRSARFIL